MLGPTKWVYYHLYVIYTDSTGADIFRGGPGGSQATPVPQGTPIPDPNPAAPAAPAGVLGNNLAVTTNYTNSSNDQYDPPDSTTVGTTISPASISAATCATIKSCFISEVQTINAAGTPYVAMGPNSNSVAYTFLNNCAAPNAVPLPSLSALTTDVPGSLTPGWGMTPAGW